MLSLTAIRQKAVLHVLMAKVDLVDCPSELAVLLAGEAAAMSPLLPPLWVAVNSCALPKLNRSEGCIDCIVTTTCESCNPLQALLLRKMQHQQL
jgi:hypothetical protein